MVWPGGRAMAQAPRAFVLPFTHPGRADDELILAQHLLTGLDLRTTMLPIRIAALVRDAGTTGIWATGSASCAQRSALPVVSTPRSRLNSPPVINAVTGAHDELGLTISRLCDLAPNGDHAYYADIVHSMPDLALDNSSPARWLEKEQTTCRRRRALVTARRHHLNTGL